METSFFKRGFPISPKMTPIFLIVSKVLFYWLFSLTVLDFAQVVPSEGLPPTVTCKRANNNLDVIRYKGKIFLAFRTAPTHFASSKTKLYIVSSFDGKKWDLEEEIHIGADMREPRFLELNSKLFFYFFEAGKNPLSFSPRKVWCMERTGEGKWRARVEVAGLAGCVLWRAKVRNGVAYAAVYCGGENMYKLRNEAIDILFLTTSDGRNFVPLNPKRAVVARGGSEADFEFDSDRTLYAVIRNEGGDGETWGGKVCKALPDDITNWRCKPTPFKYDSPLMFRHNDNIYLIARRNLDGEFDKGKRWLPDSLETAYYLGRYWFTKKRTAIYLLDKNNLTLSPLLDLPSKGDTSFPGIIQLSEREYLLYNYSSPPQGEDRFWLSGQLHRTIIYSMVLKFD